MKKKDSAAKHLIQEVIKHGLLDAIGDGVSIQDTDFRILYQNKAQKELIGDQIGKYCYDAYEKKESVCEGCPMAECFRDGKAHTAVRTAPVGSQIRYFEITSSPLKNPAGMIMAGIEIVRDITVRRNAEITAARASRALKALSACNEALVRERSEPELLNQVCRIIVERGGYRLAWIGFAGEDQDKSVTPAAQYGFENDYIKNANISWSDNERGQGPTGTAIRTGKPGIAKNILTDPRFAPWRAEAVKRGYTSSIALPLIGEQTFGALNIYASEPDAFDEEEIQLLSQMADNLSYGITALRTHTAKKISDNALDLAQREWESIFQAIGHPAIILDPDHTIIEANRAAINAAGKKKEDIIGIKCYEIFHNSGRPPESCPMETMLMSGKLECESMEMEALNGTYLVSCTPVLDDTGQLQKIIHIATDITERKNLESQLLHTQKMESIGTLAGGVAHDFNNILTAIIGFTAILKKRIPDKDPLQTYVDQIKSAANNAANLTRGLLAFSRKQKGNPVSLNLNNLVREQERLLLRIIGEDIEFTTTLSESSLFVKADPSQMEQVLMNLAANARDAMPQGGRLTIHTDSISIDRAFTRLHGFGEPGEYALISISDSGTGIDSKTRERIFEPFFTTKGVNKGTGLGLSIVYGIIKEHNGYINVYSEPGHGTTFRVYLPLIRPAGDKPAESRELVLGTLSGTETILVAEDDEAVRQLLISVLTEFGYKVIAAGDGEEAVNMFMDNRDSIRLVVSDVIMPKKNGRAVYEEIKKIQPDIKVVFLSGYSEEIISRDDLFVPGINLIQKPVNPNVFLTKIREMLDSQGAG